MKRRQFMQLLASFLILPTATVRPQRQNNNRSVLVIGAGASGLAAAQKLHQAGQPVTVLEARDRIGGRIFTDYDLAPHPVELGAEFIHGGRVITWDIMEKLGLDDLDDIDDKNMFLHLGNQLLGPQGWQKYPLVADTWSVLDEMSEAWTDEDGSDISLDRLLTEYAAEIDPPLTPEMRQIFNGIIASDYGADIDQLGIDGYNELTYQGDGDGDYRVEAGYRRVVEYLAKDLDIRFNTAVKEIRWGKRGVEVVAGDGTTYTADCAVITLPLSILQNGDVQFVPALPARKQSAIQKLGAGHVDKIILKFADPFWEPKMGFLVTSLASQVWWRPGWGRANEAPILTALLGGSNAFRFEERPAEEVIQAGLHDLEIMFGQSLSDQLVEGRFVNWGKDPFTQMGYSYVPVGGVGQRALLAEAVEDVLYFAGEATHETRAATVHGAIESGYRTAREIQEV